MSGQVWGLLLTLSGLWGGSFFLTEVALIDFPPFTLVFCRVALAALTVWGIIIGLGLDLPKDPKIWGAFLMMGLINNLIPFCLIVWGQTQITGGLASILNATTPLFVVLLAHILTSDERLSSHRFAGVVTGFAGVVVMLGPLLLGELGASILAQIAVLTAAFTYALAGIYGRRFKGVSPLITAAGQLTCSTIMMMPLMLIIDQPWTLSSPRAVSLIAIVALALLSTALAYVLYFRILAIAGATNLLLVTFLIPISALFLGILILGETLEPRQIAGMFLIGCGLALIDGRPLKALKR